MSILRIISVLFMFVLAMGGIWLLMDWCRRENEKWGKK